MPQTVRILVSECQRARADSDSENIEEGVQSSSMPSSTQSAQHFKTGVDFTLVHGQLELMTNLHQAVHQLEEFKLTQYLNHFSEKIDFYFTKDN